MPIYLDDQPVQLKGERLADLLASATAKLREEGRLVVEIQLDGQMLVGNDLTIQAGELVPDSADLRLYSADPRKLARQVLEQVRTALLEQQPRFAEAADLLQQDRAPEAYQRVNQANEVWLTTMQAVEQASQLVGLDLMKLTVAGKPFIAYTAELLAMLNRFKQQLADQDTAGLADTLGHECPKLVEQWDAVVGTLIDDISA